MTLFFASVIAMLGVTTLLFFYSKQTSAIVVSSGLTVLGFLFAILSISVLSWNLYEVQETILAALSDSALSILVPTTFFVILAFVLYFFFSSLSSLVSKVEKKW